MIESRDTSLGIDVEESQADVSGSTTPHATNRLGVEVEELLVCATDGLPVACSKLPIGGTSHLRTVETKEFTDRWSKLFAAARPQFPIGFDPNQVENASAIFGNSSGYWQQIDRGLPAPTTATSILERGLRDIGNVKISEMTPRTYIAIVQQAPNASLGVRVVSEEASFHVVTGTY